MRKSAKPFNIAEGKIQAAILLKSFRTDQSVNAAKRFKQLPEFKDLAIADILQKPIKYKHALATIAHEQGFHSWLDLKMQINFIVGGHLNLWFANYTDAKSYLQSSGGYLLPYKKQYFICNADYIKQIGFAPDDPDWKKMGYDWAVPENQAARQRLYKKWTKNLGDNHA